MTGSGRKVRSIPTASLTDFKSSIKRRVQGSVDIWVGLPTNEATWASKERVAQLRLRVDHEFSRGSERRDSAGLHDTVFTVKCSMTHHL